MPVAYSHIPRGAVVLTAALHFGSCSSAVGDLDEPPLSEDGVSGSSGADPSRPGSGSDDSSPGTPGSLNGAGSGTEAAGAPASNDGANTPAGSSDAPAVSGESTPGAGNEANVEVECVDGAIQPGTAPLRRLSSTEYLNTLRDLFPDLQPELPVLPVEAPVDSFDNDARALGASDLHVARWEEIAFRYSSEVVADSSRLQEFLPCAAGVDDDSSARACGAQLIDDFGTRTQRRPLGSEEQQRYQALFDTQLQAIDFEAAVQLTLMALMQSPRFLYRLEVDGGSPEGDAVPVDAMPLDDWEMASRLSYFLWQSMPDAELFDAAAAGLLTQDAELERQVRRMLDSPRARAAVTDFHRQWLFFDRIYREEHDTRVPDLFPDWSAANQDSAYEEMLRFVETTVFDDAGSLGDLLTSTTASVDPLLAAIYGVDGPDELGQWQTVTLPEEERAGLLTRVGFLAAHAHSANGSPPLRGVYVMQRLFCLPPVPPPPDADTSPPVSSGAALTNRELFEERTAPGECQGCHIIIDGFGFGFEHYDAIGAYRDTDNGQPVDASVNLVGTDVTGEVNGAIEMSHRLAESQQVAACAVSRWYRYSRGRSLEAVDDCALEKLNVQFAETGGNIIELMVALATSPEFRHRPEL